MSDAAIVGLGMTTPLGSGVAVNWAALLAGKSGVGPIRRFDASRYPVTFAGEVHLPHAGLALYRALIDEALDEALAGVELGRVRPERIGVFMGSEAARPDLTELADRVLNERPSNADEVAAHMPAAPTQQVARRVGARGTVATPSTACTSSGQAVGEALLAIRRGEVDVAITGGVDVLVHPLMVTGFARLGALSTRNHDPEGASRPFDLDRDGFVLGEGAGVMILASERVAARVGPVLGWLRGYGCSSNAWRITDSPPDGRGAAQAMLAALADAKIGPDKVAYVNAHGTGTAQNDLSEARGVVRALGAYVDRVPVSSTKSMMAHLVAACGVVEAIVSLLAVRERVAPPTINLDTPDPDCAVRHVPWKPVALEPGVALTNAFGFGGSNATLVVAAP